MRPRLRWLADPEFSYDMPRLTEPKTRQAQKPVTGFKSARPGTESKYGGK